MTYTPTPLVLALQQAYGPRDTWPVKIEAAHAQLVALRDVAQGVYADVLCCAVEAIYQEAENPTRYDFLGWHRDRAFTRRFGTAPDPALDYAFLTCRLLSDLLGPQHYQRVMSAAWEASRLRSDLAKI